MKEDKPDPSSPGYLRRRAEEPVRWFSGLQPEPEHFGTTEDG